MAVARLAPYNLKKLSLLKYGMKLSLPFVAIGVCFGSLSREDNVD